MKRISNNSVNMVDDVFNLLTGDDYLLRLLYYEPNSNKIHEPLFPQDNLVTPSPITFDEPPSKEYLRMWDIIDRHVLKTSKSDDLEEEKLCRIYLYLGRQNQISHNHLVRKQEIVFDVLVHNTYENDQRLNRIVNRISDLMNNRRVTGMGRSTLRNAYDFKAPNEYVGYRMSYEVGRSR